MKIKSFKVDSALHVFWENGEESEYSFLWLRDNARDPDSFDSRSHQRLVHTATIDPDIHPISVACTEDGASLLIEWQAGSTTPYPADFLFQYRSNAPSAEPSPVADLWQGQTDTREINFNELSNSSLPMALAEKGFALITDCPRTTASVEQIANALGYVRNSIFGGIWTFADNEAMDDSAYSADALRPHTDGTYCLDPPGVQILLCLEKDGEGGESILVDGFAVAAEMKAHHSPVYETLSTISIDAKYQGDGAILKARHPVFREERGHMRQVCFNNYDRDVMCLDQEKMDALYRGIRTVDSLFNDPGRQWRHTLQPGQALVFDNWRVLHGRTSYTGGRKMTGAYVNREDLDSCLRTLTAEA